MTTVDFTSFASGVRFSNFHPDLAPADYFYVFTAQPLSVAIQNIGSVAFTVWIDRGTTGQVYTGNVTHVAINPGDTFTLAWPPTDSNYAAIGFNAENSTATQHLRLTYTPPAVAPCAYGVQPNPDASQYQLISDALIDLVVTAALFASGNAEWIPYVDTALAALEGSVFVGVDCSTLPSGNTNLDFTNPGTYSIANLQSWFQNAAWHFFCQCTPAPPGSPAPVAPDLPTITPPVGVSPTQPPFTCDNTDLCAYLSGLKAELEQVLAQLGILRTDVRLIQRQKVPFAYVPGPLHSGLVDAGTFAVQGLLGLSVQLTTIPGHLGEEAGDPVAHFGAGWVTTGTPDGWRRSVPLRHNPMWVDVEPDDTLVGYSFTPGVVANIVTFAREP